MRKWIVTSVVVVSLAAGTFFASPAAQEQGADMRLVASARFVALGIDRDNGITFESELHGRNVLPEEPEAVARIRKLLETWHRYELTDRPSYAEIVIALRLGRRGSVQAGTTSQGPGAVNRVGGGVASTSDDMLSVYTVANGRRGSLLARWQQPREQPAPWDRLFGELRSAVEAVPRHP